MRIELDPAQRLLLWRLIARGGSCWQKHLHPVPSPEQRAPLESSRLIKTTRERGGNFIEVTDRGWAWAEDNMGCTFSAQSTVTAETLRLVLENMADCMERYQLPLAEVFRPEVGLEEAIRGAYQKLSQGRRNVRVRLADLRESLGKPKHMVDDVLSRMIKGKQLTLLRMDDPKKVEEADRQAAFKTPSGTELHLIYWGGGPS
ncbi:MAG: hypothetical protein AAGH89_13380 [Verrucomicrobiota bacterium]